MALISREDLKYTDYTWNSNPTVDPRFHGIADDNKFDRSDGNDVLYVINEYARENEIGDKKDVQFWEKEIHQNLSEDITTQRGVVDWLKSIFK